MNFPNDETGYFGQRFNFRMEDGSIHVVKGPFSSNAEALEKTTNRFCKLNE